MIFLTIFKKVTRCPPKIKPSSVSYFADGTTDIPNSTFIRDKIKGFLYTINIIIHDNHSIINIIKAALGLQSPSPWEVVYKHERVWSSRVNV